MRRRMMKSKIHRATVTAADLHYVGSITLDPVLMRLADIREHEQVHVLDVGPIEGDSILIISPTGKAALIDTGDTGKGKLVLDALKRYQVERLDFPHPGLADLSLGRVASGPLAKS